MTHVWDDDEKFLQGHCGGRYVAGEAHKTSVAAVNSIGDNAAHGNRVARACQRGVTTARVIQWQFIHCAVTDAMAASRAMARCATVPMLRASGTLKKYIIRDE